MHAAVDLTVDLAMHAAIHLALDVASLPTARARGPHAATQRGGLSQKPEQLVDDAQDEERLVALSIAVRAARERACDAGASAGGVVDRAAAEAALDELIVDSAPAVATQVAAAHACGLGDREVLGGIERGGDA